ncbi:hypothetical protein BJI46_06825 [Acinetobacter qingfengensis]|uniref:Secretin/TonB short N-terminal domain-containing protein n=1 Tax=Acinetobacter qingfengensis TaxID=1262585 RepID=A0A1E7QWT0_9GAMM|nr:hypothetical protein BJI46_06825 [Acinetobacter qingfengensis]
MPAAALDQVLTRFAAQAGVSLAFDQATVSRFKSSGLSGRYTIEQGFQQILTNSPYRIQKTANGYLLVSKAQSSDRPHYVGELKQIDVNAKGNSTPQTVAQLPALTVEANQDTVFDGQIAQNSRMGLLGTKKIIDIPFNVSSYTAESIENQHAITVADALAKEASIQSTHSSGGFLDSFMIRGFPIGEGNLGEIAWDGQYGVAPNYRLLTSYIDRVEVLKGPSAMLYGMSPNSGVGGAINIVPKRATTNDLNRITTDYTSHSNIGVHTDLSRRFGDEKQFGARLNVSHHDGDTAIKNQSRKLSTIALALDYKNNKLDSTIDLVWQREHFDNPVRPYYLSANVSLPAAPDGKYSAAQPWGWSTVKDTSFASHNTYHLNDNHAFFLNIGGAQSRVERLSDQTISIINEAGDTQSAMRYGIFNVDRFTIDTGLRSHFKTGNIAHEIVFQANKYQDKYAMSLPSGPTVYSNLYSPVTQTVQNLNIPESAPLNSRSNLSGFGIADTLSMFDQKFLLTLGLRQQYVESQNYTSSTPKYSEHALTPLVAAVYKINDNLSIYANHIQGLSKGDTAPDTALNSGEVFAPYKAKQYEIGIKYDDNRNFASLNAFQITKPSGQLINGYYSSNAEQQNTGVELSVRSTLTSALSAYTNLTYIDAELTKTNSESTQGNQAVGVPEWQANLGAEWTFSTLPLVIGGHFSYVDQQPINQSNTQYLPSWSKVDLNARYTAKIANKEVILRANLLNAFNKKYWSGIASYSTIALGAPRTLALSATVDF